MLAYAKAAVTFLKSTAGFDCHATASKQNAEAILMLLSQCKSISQADGSSLAVVVRSGDFVKEHADGMLSALTQRLVRGSHNGRRDYQQWTSCHNFGTRDMWVSIASDPPCATEIFSAHLVKLGLINPSEPTSAWVTAIIATVVHGVAAASALAQDPLQQLYESVKSIVIRCARTEPPVYLVELPMTAAELLKEHPALALQVSPKILLELCLIPCARVVSLSGSPAFYLTHLSLSLFPSPIFFLPHVFEGELSSTRLLEIQRER